MLVQQFVQQLLGAFVAEEQTAEHQQGHHQPGRHGADQQRSRHQNRLVDQRALGHGPDHRQFAIRLDAGDLLGIEREVVAQYAGGLARGDLGHGGDVVEYRADVVDQGEQAASGHVAASMREKPQSVALCYMSAYRFRRARDLPTSAPRWVAIR